MQMEKTVLDKGYVKHVESWGSDERIIESARMSTNKEFLGWGPLYCKKCEGRGRVEASRFVDIEYTDYTYNMDCKSCKGSGEVAGDEKLLSYLYTHSHMTPFEMAGATFEIQAPIMVFREWMRSRTQSYNEMSGRYSELPDLYYIPSIERLMAGKQSKTKKQGSGGPQEGFTEKEAFLLRSELIYATERSREAYERLLGYGVARELARLVIPVNQYSRMRASANLRNWLGFLTLRLDPSAQWEIRQFAEAVASVLAQEFPRTLQLFNKENQNG